MECPGVDSINALEVSMNQKFRVAGFLILLLAILVAGYLDARLLIVWVVLSLLAGVVWVLLSWLAERRR